MSEFNFKSSVCTSKEQSERLLALGLKKETGICVGQKWQEKIALTMYLNLLR